MKKMLIALAALLFAGTTATFADGRERPITLDKLPVAAQTFLKTHFADLTLAFATEDPKYIGSEYEVVYTDRTEVDFRTDGQWSSVERKYSAVPASIVPTEIAEYVSGAFSGQFIQKIERDKFSWEVELSNGLEIKFDRQFHVIDIDD